MLSSRANRSALILGFVLIANAISAQVNTADAVERGFQALQRDDGDTAASMFRIALAAEPRNPEALFGAGVAAHLQGRERDASAALTQALQLQPRLTYASALLGEIARAEGDLDLAIKTYEAALKYAPDNLAMRDRLDVWRREATVHSGLESLVDGRFTFMFHGPVERQLVLRARSVLDAAFLTIGHALDAYPPNSLNVILYTDQQFHDITGAPEWSGGGFDGQIRLPAGSAAQDLRLFDRVLVHELTHAMVHALAARNVPAWLHEGLAMYFERQHAGERAGRADSAHAFVPLSRLQLSFSRLNAADAAVAYEESAVAAEMLIDRLGLKTIGLALQALDRGTTVDEMIESRGFTMAEFEASVATRMGVAATRRR